MGALTEFQNDRARQEGHDSYHAQLPRHAPERFGVFSGKWVEGWEAAAFDDYANRPDFSGCKNSGAAQ